MNFQRAVVELFGSCINDSNVQSNAGEVGVPVDLSTPPCRYFAQGKRVPKDVKRYCNICRQHGIMVETRGHNCQFSSCVCYNCNLVRQRRKGKQLMSEQIRVRRKQDKIFRRTVNFGEANLVPTISDSALRKLGNSSIVHQSPLLKIDSCPSLTSPIHIEIPQSRRGSDQSIASLSDSGISAGSSNSFISAITYHGNSSPYSGSSDSTNKGVAKSPCYVCQKCKNHGKAYFKQNHKKNCEFADCTCEKCALITTRRELDQKMKQKTHVSQSAEHLENVVPGSGKIALKRKIGLSKDLRVVEQQFFGAASAKRTKIGNEGAPLLIGVNHNAAVQTGSYIAGNTQERLSEHSIPLKSDAHFPFPMSSQTGIIQNQTPNFAPIVSNFGGQFGEHVATEHRNIRPTLFDNNNNLRRQTNLLLSSTRATANGDSVMGNGTSNIGQVSAKSIAALGNPSQSHKSAFTSSNQSQLNQIECKSFPRQFCSVSTTAAADQSGNDFQNQATTFIGTSFGQALLASFAQQQQQQQQQEQERLLKQTFLHPMIVALIEQLNLKEILKQQQEQYERQQMLNDLYSYQQQQHNAFSFSAYQHNVPSQSPLSAEGFWNFQQSNCLQQPECSTSILQNILLNPQMNYTQKMERPF